MNENTSQFIKRLKSFLWRAGAIFAIALIDFLGQNIGLFNLPTWAVAVIGLASGELTKYLNTQK